MNSEILRSKKFQVMVVGLLVIVLVSVIPALKDVEENLTPIISILVAYIVGQGLADFSKEANKK